MAKEVMDDKKFNDILISVQQQTISAEHKIEVLFSSRGFFRGEQAAYILHQFASPADKVRALKIMEPRLIRMTCQEGREIIGAISIQNDKMVALDCVKRVLSDSQTKLGEEYILSCFPFEMDKMQARQILHTVQSTVDEKTPAGGHQGYAALGGLYTQCRPLVPHLYGSLQEQQLNAADYGSIEIPLTAQPGVIPSVYTGHPSYAYPADKSYDEDRGYPGNTSVLMPGEYPTGAPPLGYHSGAPAPTGFPRLPTEAMGYR